MTSHRERARVAHLPVRARVAELHRGAVLARHRRPDPTVEAGRTAVQRARAVVGRQPVLDPVEGEGGASDPVRVAADDRAEVVAAVVDIAVERGEPEGDVRAPPVAIGRPELLDGTRRR